MAASCRECITSKPQEHLVKVEDGALDTLSAALNLETMTPQLQVNLANVEVVAMDTPLAALNLETMAPQPQSQFGQHRGCSYEYTISSSQPGKYGVTTPRQFAKGHQCDN